MTGTVGAPARQLGSHWQESERQWAVAQVEGLFVVRVRPGFGQPEAVMRDWMKEEEAVAAGSNWLKS